MSDQVNTQILLTINSNIEGLRKVTDEFAAMSRKTSEAQTKVESLGDKLRSALSGNVLALGAAFKATTLSIDKMVETIGNAVTGSSEMAAEMKRLNMLFGVSAEQAQVFAKSGKMAFDDLTRYVQIFQMKVGEALFDKNGSAAKVFKEQLKIDPADLQGKSAADQLMLVADAFEKITDRNKKSALAMELFGRNSVQMTILLDRLNKEGFAKLSEETERTSGLLSQNMVSAISTAKKAASDANEKLTKEFADTNVQILKWQAGITRMLADNAGAIQKVGEALAVATIAYAAFTKMIAISAGTGALASLFSMPLASIKEFVLALKMLPSAMPAIGGAIGLALGGAIVLVVGKILIDFFEEASIKASEAIDKIREAASSTPQIVAMRTAVGGAAFDKARKAAADKLASDKARLAELDKEEEERVTYDGLTGNMVKVGLTEKQEAEREALQQSVKYLEHVMTEKTLTRSRAEAEQRKVEADAAAAKKKSEEETAEWVDDVLKKNKELTGEQRRQLALQDPSIKNSDQMRAALIAAKKATEEDYAAQIARAKTLADQTKSAELQKKLEENKTIELAKYSRAQDAIDRKDTENRQRAMELIVGEGTARDKIAMKMELIGSTMANSSLSEAERTNEILRLWKEIADIQRGAAEKAEEASKKLKEEAEDAAVEAALAATEKAQRERDQKLSGIDSNRFMTDDQKQAARYAIYQDEAAALPGQISAAKEMASTHPKNSFYAGEANRLENRQATIGSDLENNRALSLMDQIGEKMVQLETSWGTIAQNIADGFSNVIGTAMQGTSNALYDWMSGAATAKEAWQGALTSIGQSFLRMCTDMVAKMIWRSTIERALIWLGVTTHVVGEQTKTTSTLTGAAIRIGTTIKEALASVYHGAIEAFKALASIPYVGPFLAAAAMAAAIAGGIALVSKIGKGFAEGGYTGDGGKYEAAGTVHRGEYVLTAAATRRIGVGNLDAMNYGGRGFADGGYVSGEQAGRTVIMVVGTDQEAKRIAANSENDAAIVSATRRNQYRL